MLSGSSILHVSQRIWHPLAAKVGKLSLTFYQHLVGDAYVILEKYNDFKKNTSKSEKVDKPLTFHYSPVKFNNQNIVNLTKKPISPLICVGYIYLDWRSSCVSCI